MPETFDRWLLMIAAIGVILQFDVNIEDETIRKILEKNLSNLVLN